MNCDEIEELIPVYALGALEARERQGLEKHLEGCSHCSRILREHLEATAVLARMAPTAEPPAASGGEKEGARAPPPLTPAAAPPLPERPERRGRRLGRISTVGLSVAAS